MLAVPVTTKNGNNALDEAAETLKKKVRASVPKLGCSTHANISAVGVYCPVQYTVMCVCVPYVYVCDYACVCASLFKSHYKALVRLYLSLPRFRLKHSRFHLSHHDDRFYLEDISLGTPLQTRTNAQTYTSPTSPVSSVDCRLARYLFWYLFQHWLAFTSMLMILVYVLGFLLHFPLNTRELIPLSISFTRKPRLATTPQTSDRKPTRKQTKTQANTRRKI